MKELSIQELKLPAHRAGLPGKAISFYIVPLDPAYNAGLAGHVPVKNVQSQNSQMIHCRTCYLVDLISAVDL